jgi:general secretion pathway protein I
VSASPAAESPRSARRGEGGFTLLEVLVAFIIASLALGVLVRAGLDGMHGALLSTRYQEALARAKSHLAAIGDAPVPSDRQGDEGAGFHWHVRIVPLSAINAPRPPGASAAASQPPRISLMAISVAISWGVPPRTVQLDSERVIAGAPDASP